MGDFETRMGGDGDAVPKTAWSTILSCPDPDSPERRDRLNRLFHQYWRPVYKYVRASWGKSIEDAKDLTQEFFFHVLESDLIARYEQEKGRFRSFLKGSLRRFLARLHRDQQALKRGGGREFLSLDVNGIEGNEFVEETRRFSPEEIFDRQWVRDLLDRSLDRLRGELQEEGKQVYYQVYEAYALEPSERDRPTYLALAERFRISASDVDNYLRSVRARLNELLVEHVSDYVATGSEVDREMRELFSG